MGATHRSSSGHVKRESYVYAGGTKAAGFGIDTDVISGTYVQYLGVFFH